MRRTSQPKVCVIGAGAIGGFFGARLGARPASGHAMVSAVARGATLEALCTRGWVLESSTGERIVAPVRAVADPKELGPQDIVIITVKAHALADIAPLVAPLLGPSTIVVPAVNGVPWWFTLGGAMPIAGRLRSVDPHGALEAAIPTACVIGAAIYPACSSPEPGVTKHTSGSKLVFGEIGPDARPDARLETLIALLRSAGFDAQPSAQIRTEVWKKLVGNACFNPVSLITGSATDRMIDDPAIYELFTTMMNETLAVGRALGIDAELQPADRMALTRKLGKVKTSMLQDAEAGRAVELDAILGAVNELAEKLGVTTPANRIVYGLAQMRAQTFGLLKV
ncbi:MAG TPA: 2-dehydropantoate 2-reductase [Burkholderiaceae bacterium]|nr:2-dehydropantoate 2-reductase [Burkholderiaceae bacterium]